MTAPTVARPEVSGSIHGAAGACGVLTAPPTSSPPSTPSSSASRESPQQSAKPARRRRRGSSLCCPHRRFPPHPEEAIVRVRDTWESFLSGLAEAAGREGPRLYPARESRQPAPAE